MIRRFLFIGCCIFAFTAPFDFPLKNIYIEIPVIKSFLIAEITLLMLLWELVIIKERRIVFEKMPILLPFFFFFLLHLYSSIFPSDRLIWSLKYTLRFFGIGMICFIMVNFIDEPYKIRRLALFLCAGATLAALFALLQYRWPYGLMPLQRFFQDHDVNPARIRGLFGWPTNMAVYLGSTLPLLAAFLFYDTPVKNGWWRKIPYLASLSILLSALLLSRTRGWILGFVAGFTVIGGMHLLRKRENRALRFGVVLLAVVSVCSIASGAVRLIVNDLEDSERCRVRLAHDAIEIFYNNPLKGVGADMVVWSTPSHVRAHNMFLEVAATLGIFGPLLLVWLFVSIFLSAGRGVFGDSHLFFLQVGSLASLTSFLGHNLVDSFWHNSDSIALFWVLSGIGICAARMNAGVCRRP